VLRRIIRRAIRHGYKLGQKQPFFHKLVADLVEGRWARPIRSCREATQARVAQVLQAGGGALRRDARARHEDPRRGARRRCRRTAKMLDGETAFKLYDTFGFPFDLTADIAASAASRGRGGFDAAMDAQRERARAASQVRMMGGARVHRRQDRFRGYESLSDEGRVVALYRDGTPGARLDWPGEPAWSCSTARRSTPSPAARSATAASSSKGGTCTLFASTTRRRSRPTSSATTAR
jgi:alanyl-tRNA synthetase